MIAQNQRGKQVCSAPCGTESWNRIEALLAESKEPTAVDARDAKQQRPPGPPPGNKNAAKKDNGTSPEKTTVDNVHGCSERPAGTSAAAALRRLRKDRPDLPKKGLPGGNCSLQDT